MMRSPGQSNPSGSGPSFSAYLTNPQSVTNATETKVTLDTVEFNLGGAFSAGRFTPLVAGYYMVQASGRGAGTTVTQVWFTVRKNGAVFARVVEDSAGGVTNSGGCMVYLNGSTDYIELYGFVNCAGTPTFDTLTTTGAFGPRLAAYLVRV